MSPTITHCEWDLQLEVGYNTDGRSSGIAVFFQTGSL